MKRILSCLIVCLALFIINSKTLAAEKMYYIGPGDVLEISVWKDEELSRKVVVPPDGTIAFPLIESIKVLNLTVAELKNIVAKELSAYIPDPTVTVILIEINSLKAYVIGKVNNPGVFAINLETNVMQILAKAGGLNPFAAEGNINILRQHGNQIQKIPFDYGEVKKGKKLEQNIVLKTGDVIVVP